jgi:HNH endonuclease
VTDDWSMDDLWQQYVNDPERPRQEHMRAEFVRAEAYQQIKRLRIAHGGPLVFVEINVVVALCDACKHFECRALETVKPLPQVTHDRFWIEGYRALGLSRRELTHVRRAVREGFSVRCCECAAGIQVGGGEGFYLRRVPLSSYFDLDLTIGERVAPRMKAIMRELFGDCCALCGGPATTVDHIVARSRGGVNEVANLQPMCERCNAEKADAEVRTVTIEVTFPLRPPPSDGYEGVVW